MAAVGNWRNEVKDNENSEGGSPFSVIFGMIWWLVSTILSFVLPFAIFFLPLSLFPSFEMAEPYVSHENYSAYREGAQAFYLSTHDTTGLMFIFCGLALSLLCAITSLYGRTSWRLFLFVTGFALCCLSLRYMEINFDKENVDFGPVYHLHLSDVYPPIP